MHGIESICAYPSVLPVRFKRSSNPTEIFGSSPLRNVIQSVFPGTGPCLNNGCISIIYDAFSALYMLFSVTSAGQLCPLDTRAAEYNIQPIVLIMANVGGETNV